MSAATSLNEFLHDVYYLRSKVVPNQISVRILTTKHDHCEAGFANTNIKDLLQNRSKEA